MLLLFIKQWVGWLENLTPSVCRTLVNINHTNQKIVMKVNLLLSWICEVSVFFLWFLVVRVKYRTLSLWVVQNCSSTPAGCSSRADRVFVDGSPAPAGIWRMLHLAAIWHTLHLRGENYGIIIAIQLKYFHLQLTLNQDVSTDSYLHTLVFWKLFCCNLKWPHGLWINKLETLLFLHLYYYYYRFSICCHSLKDINYLPVILFLNFL